MYGGTYQGNNGGNRFGGYRNNNGYQPRYNSNNGGGNRPPKKKSGCTFGYVQGEATRPYVRGWKADRRYGLRSFIAGPNKKTKRVKSGSGREWENWTAKVQSGDGVKLFNALYDCQKKRVIIADLGIIMSPSGGTGGYVGSYFKRKQQ